MTDEHLKSEEIKTHLKSKAIERGLLDSSKDPESEPNWQKILYNQIKYGAANQTVSKNQELTDKDLKSEEIKTHLKSMAIELGVLDSSKDPESKPNWVNFDAFISEIKSMEVNSTLSQQTSHVAPKQTVVTANVKNQPGPKNQNPSPEVTKTWSKSKLDTLCKQFPVLCEMIFNNLDDQTLTKCKEVSRKLSSVLDNSRFYSLRVIKGINKNDDRGGFLEDFRESWEIVLQKAPIKIVKSLAFAIQEYVKTHRAASLYSTDHSPLHFAAYVGLFDVCRYIIEKMKDLEPELWCWDCGTSPLHMAAARGHLNVFKLIRSQFN